MNVWHSQDFGTAANIVVFVMLIIVPKRNKFSSGTVLFSWMLGIACGLMALPGAAVIAGKSVNFEYFAFFTRQFGSGFGAENIRTPGPVMVILPLIIALVVSNLLIIRKGTSNLQVNGNDLYLNGLVGLAFSGWSVLGFTYYLNRSYASGQMQILFLPIAISLGATIGSILKLKSEELETKKRKNKSKYLGNFDSTALTNLPISLIVSLPIACILLTANPQVEINRIQQSISAPQWPLAGTLASIKDSKAGLEFANTKNETVAFFGTSANYVAVITGIKPAIIFNSPFDMAMTQNTVDVGCEYIRSINSKYLVLGDEGAALFQFENKTLCGIYGFLDVPGVRASHFAQRN